MRKDFSNQAAKGDVVIARRRLLFSAAAATVLAGCGGSDASTTGTPASPQPNPPGSPPPNSPPPNSPPPNSPPPNSPPPSNPPPSPPPPPVPPPVGSTLSNFQLTSSVGGNNLPFAFGHPFRRGDIPANAHITAAVAGLSNFSADVRNRWPDGSVKFAVLSGTVNVGAGQSIVLPLQSTATAPSGTDITLADLRATGVTATIGFGGLQASWVGADWDTAQAVVQRSPAMSSWTFRKQLGSDAHLVAWLEVRCYRGGAVEVMPWIENANLNVAGAGNKSGRATFSLGGSTRYDSASDANFTSAYGVAVLSGGTVTMPHHTRIVLVSGGAHSHWLGSNPGIVPSYSRSYWESTRVTPAYLPSSIDNGALSALNQNYSPMRHVYQEQGMGGGGDDGHNIGLLPKSSVFFLVGNSPAAYRAMIANALALGSYSIHYRDETTRRPLQFASYPNLTINDGSGGTVPPAPSGTSAYLYALTHHGAANYLPYLVTGWNWFVEGIQFQTTLHYLAQSPGGRNNANYLFSAAAINGGPGVYSNAGLRGLAWQWRTAAMTASITPDADPLRAQFVTAMGYNANFRRVEHETGALGRSTAPNVFGFNVEPAPYNDGGKQITAPWQDDFITQAVGLSWDLDVAPAARRADLQWYRDFKYRSPVGRAGAQNDVNQFNYRWYHTYQIAIGPFNGENFTWYTSWRQLFESEWGFSNTGQSGTEIQGGAGIPNLFNTSYVGDMYAALVYAAEHGAPGAAAALARVQAASNFNLMISAANVDGRRAFKAR